jgi:photosystem II stability/assembly factor-like uncharacterized protein
VAASGFCLGLVLALVGCQELIVGEKAKRGEIDYSDDLYAATGIGDTHLWAAGYFGAIYHTADGGESWSKQDSGSQKSIYDISFADELNGWAVGRRGFIIHTADGGQNWERQKSPRFPPRHLFSVHAIDANVAWAVGDWGSRYVTHDAGNTWEDVSFLVDEDHPVFKYLGEEEIEAYERGDKVYDDVYLNDVFFLDDTRGWIAAEYGMIFYTADAGATWTKGEIRGTVSFEPVTFGVNVGEVERHHWDYLFEVAEALVEKPYLRVRVEGFLTPAELKKTGATNLADDRALSISDFLESENVSQERIRQVNPTPFDQEGIDMVEFTKSKLSNEPHANIKVIETPFLFDVKFTDPQNGLIAGLGGVILQTEDGGQTWDYRDSDASQGLYAIGQGAKLAWAVGEKGLHRRSSDGGMTWERLPRADAFQEQHVFFGFMRDLVFPTSERGWIVGQASFLLRSSDGGASWEKIDLLNAPVAAMAAGE